MTGAALAALLPAAPATAAAQSERTRVDTTFAFGKNGTVELGAVSGDIVVTGWTRAEAKVQASIERGTLDVSLSSTHIGIQTRSRRNSQGEARYELSVPVGTRVTARTVSGEIRVRATAAEVEVHTTSGDVEVLDASERVTIGTVSGNAHVGKVRGRVRYDAVSGDLEAEDVTGDIEAKTTSGVVNVRNARASRFLAETVSGDITYVGSMEGAAAFDISSHSGDVRLEIPASSGANLMLQSYSGEVTSQFPMTLQPGMNTARRRNRRMEFTINGGGARVTVETFSGDITIERGASRTSKED